MHTNRSSSKTVDLQTSRDRAVDFLIHSRDTSGWWRDFETLAGTSDEWVTGYVGAVLAGESVARARTAAADAWRLLCSRGRRSGGWGYSRRVPVDADSTVWALRLAAALGESGERVRRALGVADGHVGRSGGIATFRSSGPIRVFTRLAGATSFAGWCGEHVCVTAAADLDGLRARPRVLSFVRHAQGADGLWRPYWWMDPEYATMLAAQMLERTGVVSDHEAVLRAAAAAQRRIDALGAVPTPVRPSGSPFATACAASVVAIAGQAQGRDALDRAAHWLVSGQAADGGWQSSAALRIPPPAVRDPDTYEHWVVGGKGGGSIVLDQARLFTTATVLWALRTIDAALPEEDSNVPESRPPTTNIPPTHVTMTVSTQSLPRQG